MPDVLIATDADWIFDDVDAALSDEDTRVCRCAAGADVSAAVRKVQPDLVVLDLQIGNMGGIATALNLEQEFEAGATPVAPILLLLDRPADVPLARRWAVDGWLVKPLDSFRLRRAARALRRRRHLRGTVGPRRLTASDAGPRRTGRDPMSKPEAERIESRLRQTGWWLSLAERCVRDAEVGSSNLPHPTPAQAALRCRLKRVRGPSVARPVREPDSSHGCGRLSGMDHVDVDGVRIAYTRAGTGPALVMVHGAPCDSRAWQWVLPDLSRDHTVIAWDAPGFGGSSDIDENWRAPRFADALAGFIGALDLEQPYLVGWSFGTMVALSLFQRHPAVPVGLVLVGGYAGGQVR